jgi:hypothetical protein
MTNGNGGSQVPSGAGAAGGVDIASILVAAQSIIANWHEITLAKQAQRGRDRCTYWAAQEELWWSTMQDEVADVIAAADKLALSLPAAISDSIQDRGVGSPTYSGGKPAAAYMIDTLGIDNVLPPAVRAAIAGGVVAGGFAAAPLIPALVIGEVTTRLPTAADIMAGRVPINAKGLKVSDGVYLYAGDNIATTAAQKARAWTRGKYRGINVARAMRDWVDYQAAHVAPTTVANPRRKLIELTGYSTGTGPWGIWAAGDPVTPDSAVGQMRWIKQDFWAQRDDAKEDCEEELQWGRDIVSGQLDLAAQEEMRKTIALVGLLALGYFGLKELS